MSTHVPLIAFRQRILSRMDYPCPAVQDAIDRVASEFRDGRAGLLELLDREIQHPDCPFNNFWSLLLSAWKEQDVILATGFTVTELNELSKEPMR